ncbi:zinc finger, CCHC-type containing protein [Tanacetum coccineum]
MAAVVMKHMASNFAKLDKFKGTTPIPEDGGDDLTVEQVRKRVKWDNNDYVCRGLILNGISDSLFDIYQNVDSLFDIYQNMFEDGGDDPTVEQNVESFKELRDSLEAKYMAEGASSKKFLDSCIIDKLPPSCKDFKHTLKPLKEELTLVELDSHLRIEESFRVQDSDKPNGNNVAGPSVINMVEHNNSSRYNDNKDKRSEVWETGHLKKDCKGGKVDNKANGSGTNGSVDGSTNSLKGATVHVCKDRCWFKTYESLNDGSILHMGNESTALLHGCGCVDLKFSSGKIVSFKLNLSLKKKRNRIPKNLGFEFQLYLIEGTRDKVSDQHSYCFNVEDGPKIFDEAMKSQDVSFWKEAIYNEMRFQTLGCGLDYLRVKTFVHGFFKRTTEENLMNLIRSHHLPICNGHVILALNQVQVDLTKEFLSSKFSMKDMREADVILGIMIKHESNKIAISQSHYIEKVIGCLMYAMTYTRPDIAFAMGKLSSNYGVLGED